LCASCRYATTDPSRFVRRVSRRYMPTSQTREPTSVERHAQSRVPTEKRVPGTPSSLSPATMQTVKPSCAHDLRKSGPRNARQIRWIRAYLPVGSDPPPDRVRFIPSDQPPAAAAAERTRRSTNRGRFRVRNAASGTMRRGCRLRRVENAVSSVRSRSPMVSQYGAARLTGPKRVWPGPRSSAGCAWPVSTVEQATASAARTAASPAVTKRRSPRLARGMTEKTSQLSRWFRKRTTSHR